MQMISGGSEGVDLDLADIAPRESKADVETSDTLQEAVAMQNEWETGHLSAYRAAYLKTHGRAA